MALGCRPVKLQLVQFDYNEIQPRVASAIRDFCRDAMQDTQTKQIEIVVNGETRRAPEGKTLAELLLWLEVDPSRVAVELNRSIVHRRDWERTPIGDRAALEIVQFVGGG